ncbi:MAG: BamA/TamA family outer membrane protein [Ignavibacteriaceae bacterium]
MVLKSLSACFFIVVLGFQAALFAQQQEDFELSSINFEENEEFSDSELESVLQSKETPWWFWKFLNSFSGLGSPPEYYDSTSIPLDIISLKSYYAVNGFFLAEISYSYSINTSARDAELTYYIKEGPPFLYGDNQTYGLESLDENLFTQVRPHLHPAHDVRYSQEDLDTRFQSVVDYLKDFGYMLVEFDSTVISIDTIKYKTSMSTYFTSGNRYLFSDVKIEKEGEGKDLVSDEMIRYVTNINVGDVYSVENIAKSRLRLARTGLFNSINLKGVVEDTIKNFVPLLITGNIGPLNDLSPEVFADNELNTFNLGVGASYIRKNFLGDARKLTLRARFRVTDISNIRFSSELFKNTFQSEIDLSLLLEQPFLFIRSISGRLEGYLKSYNISSVDYRNMGSVLTLTVDMPSYTFINVLNPYLRLDHLSWEVPDLDTVATDSRTFTTSLGTEIGSSNTNDLFYPTGGRIISLISEIASSDVVWETRERNTNNLIETTDDLGYYYKLQLSFGLFLPISKDNFTVLGIKAKTGYIQMIEGGPELISPSQTFFAGGSNSVRGWRARELIPSDQILYIGAPGLNDELRIRGGTFLIEGSFEYRRKFEKEYGFAFFVDYGNTWNGYKKVRWDQVAVAIGTGIRYYSPIAPFRLDFGFKFYDPADKKFIFEKSVFKTMQFHFGIGEAF